MNTTYSSFKIAAVQACPVYLDLNATIDKACSLIRQAGHEGAALAAFPEAFVPGYPCGSYHPGTRLLFASFTRDWWRIP
jgi:predicted amidohydrolase